MASAWSETQHPKLGGTLIDYPWLSHQSQHESPPLRWSVLAASWSPFRGVTVRFTKDLGEYLLELKFTILRSILAHCAAASQNAN
jgi:hypothetical protein